MHELTDAEVRAGFGPFPFDVETDQDPVVVAARIDEVMEIVVRHSTEEELDEAAVARELPQWLRDSWAPGVGEADKSGEEFQRWLSRWPAQVRDYAYEQPWTEEGWLAWVEPDIRQWVWMSAVPAGERLVVVTPAINEWPLAFGGLRWLAVAAGGLSFESRS